MKRPIIKFSFLHILFLLVLSIYYSVGFSQTSINDNPTIDNGGSSTEITLSTDEPPTAIDGATDSELDNTEFDGVTESDPGGPIDPPNDVPMDGGISILLAAGIAGGFKAYRKK
jgi:hypothetical protein